jgi:glycogen operon protein
LSRVKLIAEPWDATGDGYRLGAFPSEIAEWNGRYRDTVRRFWRGDRGVTGEFATRVAGSDDVFRGAGQSPLKSINFVTAHDGFTLTDLVSFAEKHNDANGEQNRDGESQNHSSNAGVEGPTAEERVNIERARRARALLATLALSAGVPMISGGDEVGRTQHGNNNAYCHDSALTWTPWPGDDDLSVFTARLFEIRRSHPLLSRSVFLNSGDVAWLNSDGGEIAAAEWDDAGRQLLGMHLRGESLSLLIYFNAEMAEIKCRLPSDGRWTVLANSASPEENDRLVEVTAVIPAVSVVVLVTE